MSTFCRHGRFVHRCGICARETDKAAGAAPAPRERVSRRGARGRAPRTTGVVVRRQARAVDDGYRCGLVPGVRARADADRLADELAFATARLAELAADPPAPYADVALGDDPEEAHWLAFLIALLGPGEAAERRVPWATGELPGAPEHERTVDAYRAWAARAGGQGQAFAGDPAWSPQRRFERIFERLALPLFRRAARFELLTILGRTGRQELRAAKLHLGDADDPATLAAKRIFAIGDPLVLERRAADLAAAADVPLEALDLALPNWAAPVERRETRGAAVDADPDVRERAAAALGR